MSHDKVSILTFSEAIQQHFSEQQHNEKPTTAVEHNLNLQQQIHEIFTNGMWDCAPKNILPKSSPLLPLVGFLFNSDQGSTSESMIALFYDYFGYKLTAMVWMTLFMIWLSAGMIFGLPFLDVTLGRMGVFVGGVLLCLFMSYLVLEKVLKPMLMKDFSKYIQKSKESNELGDIANYYAKNSKKPLNRFFLAYIGEELVGHVAIDEWHYPGEGEDQVFRQLDEEFSKRNDGRKPLIVELRRMSVKSSHRGAGIAKKLITHLYEYAKNQCHADYLVLKTSSLQYGARKLYSNFGFELKRVDNIVPPVSLFHFVLDLAKSK
ncbi:hypothetical protein FDP41_009799 [Naegleria fowleri]|uniref:N-acetyltransferase domain-containing protein n=1 Tax=Naegleria fowleri TaxID=5763 RepID=A0A6A5AVN8_NAEFO|nr:uncharacterized protein FDP41_009799 [Naegleria fowleri]KAF0972103.1 hypothetical protein FDP41_009799 [Naegleria fowleri]